MKIAIIGTGISGLGISYLLHPHHQITVYEKNGYIGGHSRTVEVKTDDGIVPVDTGFIVFNYRNYPNLTALFEHLDVEVAKSDMSFGVSIDNGFLEYGTKRLYDIFAQKKNLFRPAFLSMVRDILKFNKGAPKYLEKETSITLGQLLDELKMGKWFCDYYLLAMGACIWSTPLEEMLSFPAKSFLRFFSNHGLLTVNDQPQWYTVVGGSREYVKKITKPFAQNIKLDCGATKVIRKSDHVEVHDKNGEVNKFDHVIFACHSDQALALIENPTAEEKDIVGSFPYQENEMVLHTDLRFMPKNKKAWASWIYLSEEREDKNKVVSLSYWMNNLQPLDTKTHIIVTLNPGSDPDPELVQDRYKFTHPVFDQKAIDAQNKIDQVQGKDRIWYCGAWQRYGFHEDGLASAVNLAKKFEIEIPWK